RQRHAAHHAHRLLRAGRAAGGGGTGCAQSRRAAAQRRGRLRRGRRLPGGRQDRAAELLHPRGLPAGHRQRPHHHGSGAEQFVTEHSREQSVSPDAVSNPNPIAGQSYWPVYHRRIARKILAEFCHGRYILPVEIAPGRYGVHSGDRRSEYHFRGEILSLDSWHIDEASLRRVREGEELAVDALEMIVDLADFLGIAREALPEYLEEFTNTLVISAGRHDARRIPAAEL